MKVYSALAKRVIEMPDRKVESEAPEGDSDDAAVVTKLAEVQASITTELRTLNATMQQLLAHEQQEQKEEEHEDVAGPVCEAIAAVTQGLARVEALLSKPEKDDSRIVGVLTRVEDNLRILINLEKQERTPDEWDFETTYDALGKLQVKAKKVKQ